MILRRPALPSVAGHPERPPLAGLLLAGLGLVMVVAALAESASPMRSANAPRSIADPSSFPTLLMTFSGAARDSLLPLPPQVLAGAREPRSVGGMKTHVASAVLRLLRNQRELRERLVWSEEHVPTDRGIGWCPRCGPRSVPPEHPELPRLSRSEATLWPPERQALPTEAPEGAAAPWFLLETVAARWREPQVRAAESWDAASGYAAVESSCANRD